MNGIKCNKVKAAPFFIETDMQEINEHGEVGFVQRGFTAEIDRPEPEKPIRVFIPLMDPEQRGMIEGSLDTEDESNFIWNLIKLQEKVPLFAHVQDQLERIYIDTKEDQEAQDEVQINTNV